MTADVDWLELQNPNRCHFYPGRDCPGWHPVPDVQGSRITNHRPEPDTSR